MLMKRHIGAPALVTAALWVVATTLPGAGSTANAAAQEQGVSLPAEVTAWLERDQMQRWAMFIQDGETLFNEGSCMRCHGEGGSGGRWAPDLTDAEWVQGDGSLENIGEIIFWGVRRRDFADPTRRFEMNPAGGMDLEMEQIAALTAYVWSLNSGTFLPQR